MFFGHTDNTGIGANLRVISYNKSDTNIKPHFKYYHQHGKIRSMTRHSKNCRFQVFLMTGQVDECHNFRGFRADFNPIQRSMFRFIDYIATTVETKDIITHRRRSPCFNFVFVPEELLPSKSSAIVQITVSQHSK